MSNKGFAVRGGIDGVRLAKAESWVESKEFKKRERQKYFVAKRWFLSNVDIECVLFRGSDSFQREKTMTCYEMGKENRSLVKKYIAELDAGKESRLWSWKIKDYDRFKEIKEKIINERKEFIGKDDGHG